MEDGCKGQHRGDYTVPDVHKPTCIFLRTVSMLHDTFCYISNVNIEPTENNIRNNSDNSDGEPIFFNYLTSHGTSQRPHSAPL
jgi:hypothetical protein